MVSFPDLHRCCLGGCIYSATFHLPASLALLLAAYLLPIPGGRRAQHHQPSQARYELGDEDGCDHRDILWFWHEWMNEWMIHRNFGCGAPLSILVLMFMSSDDLFLFRPERHELREQIKIFWHVTSWATSHKPWYWCMNLLRSTLLRGLCIFLRT